MSLQRSRKFPIPKSRWYDPGLLVSWMSSAGSVPGWTAMARFAPYWLPTLFIWCWALTPPILTCWAWTPPILPSLTTSILPSLTTPLWQNGQLCTLIVPAVNRLQNKHIHPLAKSTIGRTAVSVVSLLLLASSFPSFLFTLKRCEPLEINPSHWSERHIGICFTSFTCFATYWLVTTYVAKHILDGYHVCGETLVRCDSLVSDPSHWGDNAPQCSTVSSTELNLT